MSGKVEERVDNKVYDLRIKRGVTQEALGDALGVTRQTVIAIEKGNYAPSIALALKIARYFNVMVEEVFSIHHGKK